MAPTKYVIAEGQLHGIHAEQLRKIQKEIREAFEPNVRVSPLYDRDRGPGWVFFVTMWTKTPETLNEPRVIQVPLEWEIT